MILVILQDKHLTFKMKNKSIEKEYVTKFLTDKKIKSLDLKQLGTFEKKNVIMLRVVNSEEHAKDVMKEWNAFMTKMRKATNGNCYEPVKSI